MASNEFFLSDSMAPQLGALTIDDLTAQSPLSMEDEMLLADEAEHPLEMMGWEPDPNLGALDREPQSTEAEVDMQTIGTWPTPEVGMGPGMGPGMDQGMAPMGAGGMDPGMAAYNAPPGLRQPRQADPQDQEQLRAELAEILRMKAVERQGNTKQFQDRARAQGVEGGTFAGWK